MPQYSSVTAGATLKSAAGQLGKDLRARFGDEEVFAETEKIMAKKQLGLFTFLLLIAGTMAEAQQPVKVYKIGLLLGVGLLPSSSSDPSISTGIARVRLP